MGSAILYRYAPYSKWFGTAFNRLPVNSKIRDELESAVSTEELFERERHLVQAQVMVAKLHNESCLTEPYEIHVQKYFDRDIDVIYADRIAEITKDCISCPDLKKAPLIGSISQVGNFVQLSDNPLYRSNISALYK